MIMVSLNEIREQSPCESGWKKVLASKGGTSADMDAQFPMTDILESNDVDDAIWCLKCRPEYSSLWRKFAVWAARQVEPYMTDERSRNALDVAWRHSEGRATDDELSAAWSAARDAVRDAAWNVARSAARDAARSTAWSAAWDAARDAAWSAAWNAAWSGARDAAWRDAAWSAARNVARSAARHAQKVKLIEILTAGEWVENG